MLAQAWCMTVELYRLELIVCQLFEFWRERVCVCEVIFLIGLFELARNYPRTGFSGFFSRVDVDLL